MTAYVLHNADGAAVSIGTVLADPLPAGLTAVDLTDEQYAAVRAGTKRWDAATLALVDVELEPEPVTAEQRLAALATAVAEAEAVETIADMEALREALAAALGGL